MRPARVVRLAARRRGVVVQQAGLVGLAVLDERGDAVREADGIARARERDAYVRDETAQPGLEENRRPHPLNASSKPSRNSGHTFPE